MKQYFLGRLAVPIILLVVSLGFFLLVTEGGFLWNGNFWVKIAGNLFISLLAGAFLYYRGILKKENFPITGLEPAFGIAVLVIVLSWITSPDLRQSLERSIQLLFYLLLFYIFYIFLLSINKRMLWIALALAACAVLLVSAMVETITAYHRWYVWISPEVASPPFLYRFNGLLGNSNALMALVNLFLPVCLVLFFQVKKVWIKALLAIWLAVYALCLVFSSSRGGVLGIVGGLVTLLVFTFLYHGWQKDLITWYHQKPRLVIATLSFFVLILVTIGVASSNTFVQHPSHGSGFWDSRWPIWQVALQLWQSSPIVGIGPGRFAFDYLNLSTTIPPSTWIFSTHQTMLTVLVESGLMGFAGLIVLSVFLVRSVVGLYRKLDNSIKMPVAGGIAGLAGFAAHSMVDDFTIWPAVMIPVIFMLAWIFTSLPEAHRKQSDISLNVLWVPALVIFICTVLVLYAYAPFWSGLERIRNGDVQNGLQKMQIAIERDPNLAYYRIQAGLTRASLDESVENNQMLSLAKSDLSQAIQKKPEINWIAANLGVLEWQNGNKESAQAILKEAINAAPAEASYPLNLGYFYESSDRTEEAFQFYTNSLYLAPETSTHPYWQQTELRKEVLSTWQQNNKTQENIESIPYWQLSAAKLETDIQQASRYVALSRWSNEPALASLVAEWRILKESGDISAEKIVLEEIFSIMKQPGFSSGTSFSEILSHWIHRRDGSELEMVPGFLFLEEGVGQFEAMERLVFLYSQNGQCKESLEAWETLQRSTAGYSIIEISTAPECKIK